MLDNVPAHLDFVIGLLLIAIGFSFLLEVLPGDG